MKIKLHEIKIRDVVEGYENNDEEGVIGYGRKLNIRPAYQREFIYKDDKRNEVIRTIRNDFPLNVMYWAKSGEDSYEMLDGQQRTISFCEYIKGTFSIDYQYFHTLLLLKAHHHQFSRLEPNENLSYNLQKVFLIQTHPNHLHQSYYSQYLSPTLT